MTVRRRNVIQAEFFHVGRGGNGLSLGSLFHEAAEREADGASIKTVVRFFDERGLVTNLAIRITRAQVARLRIDTSFRKAGWFGRKIWSKILSRHLRKMNGMREKKIPLIIEELHDAVRASLVIAEERDDHSFSAVQPDELHDLFERLEKASDVRIYVFESYNLLGGTYTLVAEAM